MLEINVNDKAKNEVKAGQIRYNNSGMIVLIIHSVSNYVGEFDAIVLSNQKEELLGNEFKWNSKNQNADTIKEVYPYIAKARLDISF